MNVLLIVGIATILGSSLTEVSRPTQIEGIPKLETVKVPEKINEATPPVVPVIAESANIPDPVAPPVSSGGNIEQIIIAAANKYGIDVNRALRIAKCESGFNPNAVNYGYNENGYPSGLYQHLDGYWAGRAAKHGYAGASVFDPVANANVTMAMWAEGAAGLWECN